MSCGSTGAPGDGDGKAGRGGGGRLRRGKDGKVSAELSPAIPMSHFFLHINKTVVLLKRQVEEGSLTVLASVNSRQDGNGSLFFLTDFAVYSRKD